MMKCLTCVLMVSFVLSAAGCQKTQDAELVRTQRVEERAPTEASRPAASAADSAGAITITDLLQALEMEIWKEQVNQPGKPPVKRVALCVKPAGSEAREIMSIDIENPAQPGTLLVFLHEDRWGEFRFRAGIVYHGEDGRGHSTSNVVDDPYQGPHFDRSGGAGSIARPGIVVLRCNANFWVERDDIETTAEAAGIYVKNE